MPVWPSMRDIAQHTLQIKSLPVRNMYKDSSQVMSKVFIDL